MHKLMTWLLVKLAIRHAKKRMTAAEWVKHMPPELEAAVFTPDGKAVFLRQPLAPSISMQLVEELWSPKNEDLLQQLQQRFRRTMH